MAIIQDWFRSNERPLEQAGVYDGMVIPESEIYLTIQKLFEVGLNVMLYRHSFKDLTCIAVDVRQFQQR